MRFCSNCGLMAPDSQETQRCPKCGAVLPAVPPLPPDFFDEEPRYAAAPEADGLSMGDYLLTLLVFLIPVVGFVMMLVWSFAASTRPARRRLAQAYLIRTLALAAVVALLAVVVGASLLTMMQASYWGGYYAW